MAVCKHNRQETKKNGGAPGESRTPNPLIRSQMLYPIELQAHHRLIYKKGILRFRGRIASFFLHFFNFIFNVLQCSLLELIFHARCAESAAQRRNSVLKALHRRAENNAEDESKCIRFPVCEKSCEKMRPRKRKMLFLQINARASEPKEPTTKKRRKRDFSAAPHNINSFEKN